jgi:hypothetical protein
MQRLEFSFYNRASFGGKRGNNVGALTATPIFVWELFFAGWNPLILFKNKKNLGNEPNLSGIETAGLVSDIPPEALLVRSSACPPFD